MLLKLTPPDHDTLAALARFADSGEGHRILKWLSANSTLLLQSSCNTQSDAAARQSQGAWMAVEDLIKQAEGAKGALGTGAHG